jgi:hypothetical protein
MSNMKRFNDSLKQESIFSEFQLVFLNKMSNVTDRLKGGDWKMSRRTEH